MASENEILKYIMEADPSKVLVAFRQIEAAQNKAAASAKGPGRESAAAFAPLTQMINETRASLDKLSASAQHLRLTKTAGSELADSLLGVEQKAKGAATAGSTMSSAFGQARNVLAALGVGLGLRELVGFFNESIDASVRLRGAQAGLQAVSKNLGMNFGEASKASKDLTKDGILNLTDSSKGLQNLLASGLNLKFATELMNKNKDAAVFNRQSHLGLSESIKVFTQGFKDELSTLTDATGVSINYGRALEGTFKLAKAGQIDYTQYRNILSSTEIEHVKLAIAHTNSADKLDKQSKSILAGIGFLKELGLFSGNAASASEDFAIKQAQLQNQMELTRAAIGERLQPAYLGLLAITLDVLKATKDLFEFFGSTGGINEYTGAIGAGAAAWALWRFVPWSAGVTLIANAVSFLALALKGLAAGEGLTILGLIGAKLAQITAGSAAVSAAGLIGLGASFGALAGTGVSAYKSIKNEDLSRAQSIESLVGLVNTLQNRGINAKPFLQQFNAGKISEDEARRQLGILANEDFKANRSQYPGAPPSRAGLAGGGTVDPDAFKKIAAARQSVDEQIASLNRKALNGIAAQFDEIDQRFRKIIEAEQKTGGAVRPGTITAAEQAATAAKIAARNEVFAKAGLTVSEEGGFGTFSLAAGAAKGLPSQEEIQKEINATLEVANKAYVIQIDNEFKLKQAMFATENERLARIGNMEAEIEVMDAAAMGRNKHESQLFELLAKQKQASAAVSDPAELAVLEKFQGRKQLELLRNQYDETFDKIRTQAEGVFDAIFLRGKKGFAGLLDYIKGTFITGMKDLFGNLVATLFTGARPGGGGAAQSGGLFGGLFSGISGLFGGARQGGGGGGLFSGLGGLFGGGGGIAGTPPFLPARGGFGGGLGSLLGLGGTGAGLAAGGAALTPGVAGALPTTFANTGLLPAGGAAGSAAGGSSFLGLSGAQLGAFFTNPFTIAAGIGIAATIAYLKLRKTREEKFRAEILRDFAINVPDNKILKQIKNYGETVFGKDADKKRFETLRLDQIQGLLLNYATASGQDPSRLPIYQKFYGGSAGRSLSFDPSRGVPAFEFGTPYVPRTGLAMVHQGEAIIPAAQNKGTVGGNFIFNIDARGATADAASAIKSAVRQVIREERRYVTEQVGTAINSDYRRQNILGGLIGT